MINVAKYVPEMLANRRAIHQHPEEGWTEFETTARIVQTLRSFGLEVKLGLNAINPDTVLGRDPEKVKAGIQRALANGVPQALLDEMQGYTGAVTEIDTGRPGPLTVYRFDIDCVCVDESHDASHLPAAEGFASQYPGLMHACGHDGHTAVGLALAHWLHDEAKAGRLAGKFRLLFQPAEEGARGAGGMAGKGWVDDADWFFASHVGIVAKPGEICVMDAGFLATTKFDIAFTGTPSHAGADPQKGRSALLAASACALMLAGIPRHGEGATRIAIGTLHAGEGRNVTPAHAVMEIEVRGETAEINDWLGDRVTSIVKGAAESYEVKSDLVKRGEATTLVSNPEASSILDTAAHEIEGVTVRHIEKLGGSEDCTTLIRRAQQKGAKCSFFLFGCNHHGHHRSDFEIQDDKSLPMALEMFERVSELVSLQK